MPHPKNTDAFRRVQDLLDHALNTEFGILYPCKLSLAQRLSSEVDAVRIRLREQSKILYPFEDPRHGRSVYDRLYISYSPKGLSIRTQIPKDSHPNIFQTLCSAIDKGYCAIQFADYRTAKNYRRACYKLRDNDRKSSPEGPMKGRSKFDCITLRISPTNILTIEAGLWDETSIIELDSVDSGEVEVRPITVEVKPKHPIERVQVTQPTGGPNKVSRTKRINPNLPTTFDEWFEKGKVDDETDYFDLGIDLPKD